MKHVMKLNHLHNKKTYPSPISLFCYSELPPHWHAFVIMSAPICPALILTKYLSFSVNTLARTKWYRAEAAAQDCMYFVGQQRSDLRRTRLYPPRRVR